MKLFDTIIPSLFIKSVLSTKNEMVDFLTDLAHLQGLDMDSDANFRGFDSGWAANMIASIDGYGCWCYFQNDHGRGRGSAQNEVDELCKTLHHGYSCIIHDGDTDNYNCTPWDITYKAATGFGADSDNPKNEDFITSLRRRCNKANKGESKCKSRTCMVEGHFVIRIFELFLKGVVFDPLLLHSNGNFDPLVQCKVKTPIHNDGESKILECCGDYPTRFPFKTNGVRQCCGQSTFDSRLFECCPDGSIGVGC